MLCCSIESLHAVLTLDKFWLYENLPYAMIWINLPFRRWLSKVLSCVMVWILISLHQCEYKSCLLLITKLFCVILAYFKCFYFRLRLPSESVCWFRYASETFRKLNVNRGIQLVLSKMRTFWQIFCQ